MWKTLSQIRFLKKVASKITEKNALLKPQNSTDRLISGLDSINGATMTLKNKIAFGFDRLMIKALR